MWPLKMNQAKKRKIDEEHRIFKKEWTSKYLFTEFENKAICLVCKECIAVFKEYNLKRHFSTKHEKKYNNLSEDEMNKIFF